MQPKQSPLTTLAYLIVALVALVIAAGIVRFLLTVIAGIAAMLLSVVIMAAIVYGVYLMLKALDRRS